MRALLLIGLLVLQITEPPEYPKGEYCAHIAHDQRPAHACACHRMCADPTDPSSIVEDAHCTQWCHSDHCRCETTGCP